VYSFKPVAEHSLLQFVKDLAAAKRANYSREDEANGNDTTFAALGLKLNPESGSGKIAAWEARRKSQRRLETPAAGGLRVPLFSRGIPMLVKDRPRRAPRLGSGSGPRSGVTGGSATAAAAARVTKSLTMTAASGVVKFVAKS